MTTKVKRNKINLKEKLVNVAIDMHKRHRRMTALVEWGPAISMNRLKLAHSVFSLAGISREARLPR